MSNNIINLSDFLTDDVNIIEIFFCKSGSGSGGSGGNGTEIDVRITSDIESIVEKKYKKYKEEKYKSYHHKDKVYTYELSNDNQYVSSKITTSSIYAKPNIFILSSKIDKFPQYIFPCTNDIDNISTYTIKEFKINNRISLMIRYDYSAANTANAATAATAKSFYIEYRHSPNVEIDKINEYVNNIINTYAPTL
jgi:hypothetical protein